MSEKYLLNALPSEFIALAKKIMQQQMNMLYDDNDTTDESLAKIEHKNILQSLLDKIDNPHQTVVGQLYAMSENADGTQSTLQNFGKPIVQGETIKWVFLAQDFDEASTTINHFLFGI